MAKSGINNSSYMAGGRNLRDYPGSHALKLLSVEGGETFKKREKFIPTFEVMASTNVTLAELLEKGGKSVKVADPMIMNDYPDYFYTEIRGLLAALTGEDAADDEIDWQEHKDKAEDGGFDGNLVAADVYPSGRTFAKGKKAGQEIHNVAYEPGPEG